MGVVIFINRIEKVRFGNMWSLIISAM